jgi:hypothetical protein
MVKILASMGTPLCPQTNPINPLSPEKEKKNPLIEALPTFIQSSLQKRQNAMTQFTYLFFFGGVFFNCLYFGFCCCPSPPHTAPFFFLSFFLSFFLFFQVFKYLPGAFREPLPTYF